MLKDELSPIYIRLHSFYNIYFRSVTNLKIASQAFFEQCLEGSDLLFESGWKGWPKDANQDDVLS